MPTSLPEHFEDFAEARREGFLRVKELKDKGENICGAFCQYTPSEIIYAAGLYQVALCGRSPDPIKTAETRLPANLCPLIKASYGHPWKKAAHMLISQMWLSVKQPVTARKKCTNFLGN